MGLFSYVTLFQGLGEKSLQYFPAGHGGTNGIFYLGHFTDTHYQISASQPLGNLVIREDRVPFGARLKST